MSIRELVILICILIGCIAMAVVRKKGLQRSKYGLIVLVPLCMVIVQILVYRFSYVLIPMYAAGIILAIMYTIRNKKVLYWIGNFIVLLCVVAQYFFTLFGEVRVSYSYEESFKQTLKDMKQEYVLSEVKQINYDDLYKKYLPMFKKADKEKDEVEAYITWLKYGHEFNDGHVSAHPIFEGNLIEQARKRLAGNDYGLSLLTLTSGETVAILVDQDSEAYKLGINDGTVITSWNDAKIDELKKNITCVYPGLPNFPVKDNEEQFKSFFIAGIGDDTVGVTYIGDDGQEHKVELNKIGNYSKRLNQSIKFFLQVQHKKNLSWEILNGQSSRYGYLCLNKEEYGSGLLKGNNLDACGKIIENMIKHMKDEQVKEYLDSLSN